VLVIKTIAIILLLAGSAWTMPQHVDLEVGEPVVFDGRVVTLMNQSIDGITVEVDGIRRFLNLVQSDCGSPRRLNFTNVNGVEILPDIVSDIQNYCKENTGAHRRWIRHRVGWEIGNVSADYDVENYARLVLKRPGDELPDGHFPVETSNPCGYMDINQDNYFLSYAGYGIHSGIDFFDTMGTRLYAVADGTITHLERSYPSGYPCASPDNSIPTTLFSSKNTGNHVIFKDDNYRYKYGHFNVVASNLYVGKHISKGDYLGTMGCTASSVSHLHFAMFLLGGISPHYDEFNINPYPFLKKWACSDGCQVESGRDGYCAACGPCNEGEGDCDNDSECVGGLVCPQSSSYNPPGNDYCEQPDCGLPVNHNDYCRDCGPCTEGQGDCDDDDECLGDLVCPQVNGTDTCKVDECPYSVGQDGYCEACGPCTEGQGDCDSDDECMGDLVCPQNGSINPPGIDYCEQPGEICEEICIEVCEEVCR